MKTSDPIVYKIDDTRDDLNKWELQVEQSGNSELALDYPTVYIHNARTFDKYIVYIGESNNIIQRTLQHYAEKNTSEDWKEIICSSRPILYIICHRHFNKSLTLDIENRLMLYLSCVNSVERVFNKRENQQNKYYTSCEKEAIFQKIWDGLNKSDSRLFPGINTIEESAIFKASPLHDLTVEQEKAKDEILVKIEKAIHLNRRGELIFVSGEAGTGKTVLNSSLFYDLCKNHAEQWNCCLLVNHEQQLIVYKEIARKLGLTTKKRTVVYNPTSFILQHSPDNIADVVLIDEAHLLWTQGKQAYRGKNQLADIRERSKVVVIMFDLHQVLRTEQYWENNVITALKEEADLKGNFLELKNQLRIHAGKETIDWIQCFTKEHRIRHIPHDNQYQLVVFDNPQKMEAAIRKKAKNDSTKLSRLVATFDWEYVDKKPPTDRLKKYWEVCIDNWSMPWNFQAPENNDKRSRKHSLSWAEQEQTINEVGSTFTIQGFDLNYVGVILGPSVKYKNGKIYFDSSCCKNRYAVHARMLQDGTKRKFAETLISNSVNILMTRGVDGLFIYAQDEKLRKALIHASDQKENVIQ